MKLGVRERAFCVSVCRLPEWTSLCLLVFSAFLLAFENQYALLIHFFYDDFSLFARDRTLIEGEDRMKPSLGNKKRKIKLFAHETFFFIIFNFWLRAANEGEQEGDTQNFDFFVRGFENMTIDSEYHSCFPSCPNSFRVSLHFHVLRRTKKERRRKFLLVNQYQRMWDKRKVKATQTKFNLALDVDSHSISDTEFH